MYHKNLYPSVRIPRVAVTFCINFETPHITSIAGASARGAERCVLRRGSGLGAPPLRRHLPGGQQLQPQPRVARGRPGGAGGSARGRRRARGGRRARRRRARRARRQRQHVSAGDSVTQAPGTPAMGTTAPGAERCIYGAYHSVHTARSFSTRLCAGTMWPGRHTWHF